MELESQKDTFGVKANNSQYVVAVSVMIAIAIAGIVLVETFRPGDNTATIAAIVGLLTPTTLSLLAFMKAQETHLSVNSRLESFIKSADIAARSEGLAEGITKGTKAANERTDELGKSINTEKTVVNSDETTIISKPRKE